MSDVELTAEEVRHVAALARLGRTFPGAKWIWIVRHPGSVTRSIENMPMAEVMLTGYEGGPEGIWKNGNTLFKNFLEVTFSLTKILRRSFSFELSCKQTIPKRPYRTHERLLACLGQQERD